MGHKIIFCVGLYRSASTWVFNVCRAICERKGTPFTSLYADYPMCELLEKAVAANVCIVKSHRPDVGFNLIFAAYEPPLIVSVRDPRDCVASLMTQFRMTFENALDWVEKSAAAMAAMPLPSRSLILKYESPDWRDAGGVMQMARLLDAGISSSDAKAIAEKFSPRAVDDFLKQLEETGYFDSEAPAANQHHADTHFHPHHVGDGEIGKFSAVLTKDQERLTLAATRDFRQRFGYDIRTPPIEFGETLDFGQGGRAYLSSGFGVPEDWGVWTVDRECEIDIALPRPIARATLFVECFYGPAFRHGAPGRVARLFVNDALALEIERNSDRPPSDVLTLHCDIGGADRIRVAIAFDQILTAKEAGWNIADNRPIGLGLRNLRVETRD
ncbi:hypothetical protein [Methylocystis parvus]|uniref:Sulfotransferase domain-containing protein n=1 Tax=Methylocystis parvus TaxID=134 RepID=A0A6B8M4J9_9HYPH|nr:hypothetical protein [Methylocystis parvus]QGM98854.1 hypothetical protein F7D14_16110 [Methylocystis parvus]WBK00793.1 sulfotransferase domain-containing protein [Methylocystis parvus OBBP]